jgi:thioredoxin-related protein
MIFSLPLFPSSLLLSNSKLNQFKCFTLLLLSLLLFSLGDNNNKEDNQEKDIPGKQESLLLVFSDPTRIYMEQTVAFLIPQLNFLVKLESRFLV